MFFTGITDLNVFCAMVPPGAQNRSTFYFSVKMELLSFLFPIYPDHHVSEGNLAQFMDQEQNRVRLELSHRKIAVLMASTGLASQTLPSYELVYPSSP